MPRRAVIWIHLLVDALKTLIALRHHRRGDHRRIVGRRLVTIGRESALLLQDCGKRRRCCGSTAATSPSHR